MIYLDTSVALAHLLAEDRSPPDDLWSQELISSRLLEYELWNRLHASGSAVTCGDAARVLTSRLNWIELHPDVLERALHPFPTPVRPLDAIHLSSALFLTTRGHELTLATYDRCMARAADAVGLLEYEVA